MRTINHLVLHCTATPQDTTVESIRRYWREELGWKNPGYHFLIEANGTVHHLLPVEQIANGVQGHNRDSIHISFIGGIDRQGNPVDNRTPQQIHAQLRLLTHFLVRFPGAKVMGHRDFAGVTKVCPSFDVNTWLAALVRG